MFLNRKSFHSGNTRTKIFMRIALWLYVIFYGMSSHCSFGQTTNESPDARYFREIYNSTTWGAVTNGIQFGVRLSAIGPSSSEKFKIFTFLNDTNATTIYGLWKLPLGYRFEGILLKDLTGSEIKQTATGDALCKTPHWDLFDGKAVVLNPKLLEVFDAPFDIRNCFKISKAGIYFLTVKPRLYSMKSYNELVKLDIPEVCIKVTLSESDLEQ